MLAEIDLDENQITKVKTNAFFGLRKLKKIYLRDNNIADILEFYFNIFSFSHSAWFSFILIAPVTIVQEYASVVIISNHIEYFYPF